MQSIIVEDWQKCLWIPTQSTQNGNTAVAKISSAFLLSFDYETPLKNPNTVDAEPIFINILYEPNAGLIFAVEIPCKNLSKSNGIFKFKSTRPFGISLANNQTRL